MLMAPCRFPGPVRSGYLTYLGPISTAQVWSVAPILFGVFAGWCTFHPWGEHTA
jgi:hypothetical protein